MKGKLDALKAAFNSAKSSDAMLKTFKKMEIHFPEKDLGFECWKLADKLYKERQDPHQIISFGNRALKHFLNNNNNHTSSLIVTSILNLLAFASRKLERYGECVSYLNWADRNLCMIIKDNAYPAHIVLPVLRATHLELFTVKTTFGQGEEAVIHKRTILEFTEKSTKEGSVEIGEANSEVAEAYFAVMNFEEALPFSLKALDIFTKCFGDDSVEVTRVRQSLAAVYAGLKEYGKALEFNRLYMKTLKSMGISVELNLLHGEMQAADMLIALGRFEEGVDAMKSVVSDAERKGVDDIRAGALLALARAFVNERKFLESKKYMKIAKRVIEKKEMIPLFLATGLEDMSKMYEYMKEYETAIPLLRRALAIHELPQNHFLEGFSRLFSMIFLTGKLEEGIEHLEDVVEMMEEKFGPEHCQLGYGYMRLGECYVHLRLFESAARCFVLAKDILDVSLGPHHFDSLKASQFLCGVYAESKRYDQAIEIQEKAVDGYEALGPSGQKLLDVAVGLLKNMKVAASGEFYPEKNAAFHSEDGWVT